MAKKASLVLILLTSFGAGATPYPAKTTGLPSCPAAFEANEGNTWYEGEPVTIRDDDQDQNNGFSDPDAAGQDAYDLSDAPFENAGP